MKKNDSSEEGQSNEEASRVEDDPTKKRVVKRAIQRRDES